MFLPKSLEYAFMCLLELAEYILKIPKQKRARDDEGRVECTPSQRATGGRNNRYW